jgi:hypothetical protein
VSDGEVSAAGAGALEGTPIRHTLSRLMQARGRTGMPLVHLGAALAGTAAGVPTLLGDPTRQTFDALIQVLPQGMPFLQLRCASTLPAQSGRRASVAIALPIAGVPARASGDRAPNETRHGEPPQGRSCDVGEMSLRPRRQPG